MPWGLVLIAERCMLARRIGGELSRLGNSAGRGGDNSCELSRAMAGGVISEKGITGGTGWAGVGLVRFGVGA